MLLARLEAQPPTATEEVDLADLVATCLAGRSTRPDIAVTFDTTPVVVLGRRAQLARLLGNLLDNAERHAATTVTVSVGPDAVLTVGDDGPGIPEAERQRVFDRFVRLPLPD